MALLERAGYRCTRSAASLGAWDIIGVGLDDFVLVQVKSNKWPGRKEMKVLEDFRCPFNCRKLVHRWRDGMGIPDVRDLKTGSEITDNQNHA
jgi:hypothetical protein